MASPEQVIESYIMQAAIQYSQSHGFSPENEHEMKEFLELNMDNILVLAKKMMFDVLHKLENKETREAAVNYLAKKYHAKVAIKNQRARVFGI